jgi:preprotein translocase subunit SecF
MTSLTTIIALFALAIFGGEVIRDFTYALIWGIVIGTYSSIFVASCFLLFFRDVRYMQPSVNKADISSEDME